MPKPIQVSIPTPCHENWQEMTPTKKGGFCASCQKNVLDFTNASDREIAAALKGKENACGRFRTSQLERNLIVPKEKNSLWIATGAAVLSFLALGANTVYGQKVQTEQHESNKNQPSDTIKKQSIKIHGIVKDQHGYILPGTSVVIQCTEHEVQTDFDGKFEIEATIGDTLMFEIYGLLSKNIIITDQKEYSVILNDDPNAEVILVGAYSPQRTFFGRMFHSIGNWFR